MGGGKSETYITEAKTTMFHSFFRTKILAPGESVSDFTEVTEAERQKLLDALAAWKRPPQVFIDLWDEACKSINFVTIGRYNEATGYFELNGLKNITYEQALRIYNVSCSSVASNQCNNTDIRTNLLTSDIAGGSGAALDVMPACVFRNCYLIEIARISRKPDATAWGADWRGMFTGCSSLREIIGIIGDYQGHGTVSPFYRCAKLEKVKIHRLGGDIDFSDSPLIDLESFTYTVNNRATDNRTITITVHPNVYAKLTGDTTNAAVSALSAEELAEWSALPALAAEKNITFVSA